MSHAIDPIEFIRGHNPVPPGALRELAAERTDELLARLRADEITVPQLRPPHRRVRYLVALAAVAVCAAGAVVGALVTRSSRAPQTPPTGIGSEGPPIDFTGNPLQGRSIAVTSASEADASVPFDVVLPANATPTGMWVTDPSTTPEVDRTLIADFDTPTEGVYQLSEQPRGNLTVANFLYPWAKKCTTCTIQKVVTVDGIHVLVMATPDESLGAFWLRGDGAGPVLTSVYGPYGKFTEQSALSVAANLISHGG